MHPWRKTHTQPGDTKMFATILITLALIFVLANMAIDYVQVEETVWAATLEIIDRAEYQPVSENPECGGLGTVAAWHHDTVRG